MAASDLTDWNKVKAKLPDLAGTSASDATIQELVTQASDAICSELSRQLISGSVVEIREGTGACRMMTRRFPITAVGSVVIDGATIPASSSPTVNGWYLSGAREISLRGYRFNRTAPGNVVLTYTAGYVLGTTLPLRFERMCQRTALAWFKELDRIGQTSVKIGEEAVATYSLELPPDVVMLLENERDVVPV